MIHDTIVLGAGIAGLAAAGVLRGAGREVLVLEKSRGLGGRAATRRWDSLPVDHGAQFFTARSGEFKKQVDTWVAQDICHQWCRGFHHYRSGLLSPPDGDDHPRYACRGGMSLLGSALAAEHAIDVERETKVVAIGCESGAWILSCDDGSKRHAHRLVVTCPPPQGATLLAEAAPAAADLLQGITMDPCLAVVAQLPRREIAWQGIQSDDAMISWISHDTSKRFDLHGDRTLVVIHASRAFSREQYAAADQDIIAAMLDRASAISATELTKPGGVFLQRWRYAMPTHAQGGAPSVHFDVPAPLVLAGESFAGGKIEGAWLSGRAAGEILLRL
jgi:predicted NAD/FAD-dependent oxidoreductase